MFFFVLVFGFTLNLINGECFSKTPLVKIIPEGVNKTDICTFLIYEDI